MQSTEAARWGRRLPAGEEVLSAQRKLGIDITEGNAGGSADLPMPSVLVVDPDRAARFADVQADYTSRTEVSEILAAVSGAS